jgi:hypothetical protein
MPRAVSRGRIRAVAFVRSHPRHAASAGPLPAEAPLARRGARRPLPHRAPADGRYARYEYILL